jgi:hypothetical protein
MAKVFLSCSVKDGFDLAQQIEKGLVKKDRRISIPVEFKVAGNWRNKLTKGLITSDALIAFLTHSALESRYALGGDCTTLSKFLRTLLAVVYFLQRLAKVFFTFAYQQMAAPG